jgi:hypothetical protein
MEKGVCKRTNLKDHGEGVAEESVIEELNS